MIHKVFWSFFLLSTFFLLENCTHQNDATTRKSFQAGVTSHPPEMATTVDIHQAAADGDLKRVTELVTMNPKIVMEFNDVQDLPIRAAILNGHTEIAKILLSHMDDVDAENKRKITPLLYAAYSGNADMTKLLIERGANILHVSEDGRSALYYAAMRGNIEVAEILIASGAKTDEKTKGGDTPLRIAIENHHQKMIDLLVLNHVQLDIQNEEDGLSFLHKLAAMGREKLVASLIANGVDMHTRDKIGRTLLHNAAAGGLNVLLKDLVQQGMDVNTTDIYGSTPLHESVFFGHKKTVLWLLSKGAAINPSRPDGTTPFHLARSREHHEIAALLKEKGAQDGPKNFPRLEGEYLGQIRPGNEGKLFAPGIVSRAESHDSLKGFYENNRLCIIFQWPIGSNMNWTQWPPFLAKKVGDTWQAPTQSDKIGKPWFFNLETVPDGERMIFAWRKNFDGSGPLSELYLWSAVKLTSGWAEPSRFPPPINQGFDTWPSLSDDKTMYFHSWRAGSVGKDDIYVSKLENGAYRAVENLGEVINTKDAEHDAFIAPDGSYLLFSSFKPGGLGVDDIYLSFRQNDGSWCKPKNLGDKINSKYSDNRAFVSSDGKYLFYTSLRTGNLDVYWVSAEIIDSLKNQKMKPSRSD